MRLLESAGAQGCWIYSLRGLDRSWIYPKGRLSLSYCARNITLAEICNQTNLNFMCRSNSWAWYDMQCRTGQ